MEKILTYISKNIISVLGITILTGTTLTTSALGVMKVANNFDRVKVEVPEVKDKEPDSTQFLSPTPQVNEINGNTTNSSHPVGVVGKTPIKTSLIPTSTSVMNSLPNQGVSSANSCIVTLFGKQYDVTTLRTTHSGGNIFNCGTDMSAVYQGRHGTNMSRMQQYLVIGGTTSSNGGFNNSGTSGGSTGGNTGTSASQGQTEIQREEEHEEEIKTEERHRDEDHEEEEKEHLETFIRSLLRLGVS